MRLFAVVLAVLVLSLAGWSGWWWFGASSKAGAVEDWLAGRRADGWAADAAVTVAGWPMRFDMTVADLTLADPAAGWAWSAPVFRTFMLAYAPNRVIAEWPGVHAVSVPGETAEAEAETFRASARFVPTTALAIDQAVLEAEGLTLRGGGGWTAGLARGQLSLRRSETAPETPNAYDAVMDLRGLAPPEALRGLLAGALGDALPERVTRLSVDLTAALGRPLDRRALEESDFRPEALDLHAALLRWGPLGIEAAGRLDVDAAGVPTGRLDLEISNWRAMLDAAAEGGALAPGLVQALRAGLGLLAMLSADPERLSAPLIFEGGSVSLGPIPLGPAPRF